MTTAEYNAVVAEVKAEREREFATSNRWNDHETNHLPHDLPPRPAPENVDRTRYEALIY